MSTPNIPSADQLAANRKTLWHQDDNALLTIESLRAWLTKTGLVLYTPRAAQLPSPAPSLVEAVLGTPNTDPTLAESAEARSLLARLIGEGSAVPLNLLGTTGDTPDFIVSAAVFPYIFTVRGDKAWKLPPATQGAVKVSPLALATYEVLARRVTLSAQELVDELGKEVTEGAVLRALSELWAHLRVIPIPQNDGPTMWELTSTRFTKQIKAGANAGQPKALSALISLYLGMAVVATEEEIETILSPLASRSRIREVLHALMGARELETIAIDGRTVVHVAGDLPAFASTESPSGEEGIQVDANVPAEADGEIMFEGTDRIKKFVAKPRKIGTGFAKSFNPRPASPRPDTERRPFKKPFGDPPSRPSFSKPWDENRPARPAAADGADASTERPRYDRDKRPSFGSNGSKPFGSRPSFGSKPVFGRNNEGGTRPTFRRDDSARPPRRDFTPRPSAEGASFDASARPERKTFSKPGTFGRKREGGFPPRPPFGGGEGRPQRSFTGRDSGPSDAPRRPYNGDRPSFNAKPAGERRPGSYSPRPSSSGEGFAGRKPFTPRAEGGSYPARKPFIPGGSGKPGFSRDRDQSSSGSDAPRKIFRKFDAPRFDKPKSARPFNADAPSRPYSGDRPARPSFSDRGDRPARPSFPARSSFSDRGDRPQSGFSKPGGFAGKKPFGSGRPSGPGSKPPGTFAKFADGAKPFRKPGPGARKFGPKTGSGGKSFGGPRPEYRKRKPEEGESA